MRPMTGQFIHDVQGALVTPANLQYVETVVGMIRGRESAPGFWITRNELFEQFRAGYCVDGLEEGGNSEGYLLRSVERIGHERWHDWSFDYYFPGSDAPAGRIINPARCVAGAKE